MSRKNLIIAALLFIMQSAVCTMVSAQNLKEIYSAVYKAEIAVDKIESIVNVAHMDPTIPLEEHAYLVPMPNIRLQEKDNRKTALIPPGWHSYVVDYHNVNKSAYSIRVDALFEAGKFYTFEYKLIPIGKKEIVSVSLVEITDEQSIGKAKIEIEILKEHLAWSQTHPLALEGTYKTTRKIAKKDEIELTFSGNQFNYKFNKTEYEGFFTYSDELIIANYTSVKKEKQERKPYFGSALWYYRFNDGTLEILGSLWQPSMKTDVLYWFYNQSDAIPSGHASNLSAEDALPVSQNSTTDTVNKVPKATQTATESLEGTYKTKNQKGEIRFAGNTFYLVLPNPLGNWYYEGTYSFDENMITLNPESQKMGKTKAIRFNKAASFSYHLIDGVLNIKSQNKKNSLIEADGFYYKVKE